MFVDYYEVDELKNECAELLFSALGQERVSTLVQIADQYSIVRLQLRCSEIMADDFEKLVESKSIFGLSVGMMEALVQADYLGCDDERFVLRAVKEYAESCKNEQDALIRLVPHIKFGQLGATLSQVARDASLLTIPSVSQKVIDAFIHISFPDLVEPREQARRSRRKYAVSNPDSEGAQHVNSQINYDQRTKTYTRMVNTGHKPIVGHEVDHDVSVWKFSIDALGSKDM